MSFYGSGVTDPTGLTPRGLPHSSLGQRMPNGSPHIAASAGTPPWDALDAGLRGLVRRVCGGLLLMACAAIALSLLSWSVSDPSLTHAASGSVGNWMGPVGAVISDLLMQTLGLGGIVLVLPPAYWGVLLSHQGRISQPRTRMAFLPLAVVALALAASALPTAATWPLRHGYGGMLGDLAFHHAASLFAIVNSARGGLAAGVFGLAAGLYGLQRSFGLNQADLALLLRREIVIRPAAQPAALQSAPPHPPPPHSPQSAAPYGPPAPHPIGVSPPYPAFASGYAMAPSPAAPSVTYAPAPAAASHPVWSLHATAHQYVERPHPPLDAASAHDQTLPWPVAAQGTATRSTVSPVGGGPVPQRQAGLRPAAERPVMTLGTRHNTAGLDRQASQEGSAMAARFAPTGSVHYSSVPDDIAAYQDDFDAYDADRESDDVVNGDGLRAGWSATEYGPHESAIMPSYVPSMASHDARYERPLAPIVPGGYFDRLTGGAARRETPSEPPPSHGYRKPSLSLLQRLPVPAPDPEASASRLRERSLRLLEILADFGIQGEITALRPGPVVTLIEFQPAPGIKLARAIARTDDIARAMGTRSVRIAVVPGANAIGIELPNAVREPVALRELLETDSFRRTAARLPLMLGKAINGEPIVADLARMPHLLLAGTAAGSGKSISVHAMILSLLFHLTPEDVRLILIDPKSLELSVYDGIPHLLTPIVSEPEKAVAALTWAIGEMERRNQRMAEVSVRTIEAFNARVRESGTEAPLPLIVIVVAEFADLMTVADKAIEGAVQRLAQSARAAGIHLIMATERPSSDIVTGTLKANFPTRVAFRLSSRVDSRTILDEAGAEQLLGQGDMLYASGASAPLRVHGPFVSGAEIEAIVHALRSQGTPDYVTGLTDVPERLASRPGSGSGIKAATAPLDDDDLYDRAVALVRAQNKVSISYIKRTLAISYNLAATLVERMEDDTLVSPPDAAGKRDVLPVE